MADVAETLDDTQLHAKITEVFESWPLYRKLLYAGADYASLPEHVSLFCPICKKGQWWRTNIVEGASYRPTSSFGEKAYTCRNCGNRTVRYYFRWRVIPGGYEFFKVGQWPPLDESVTDELQKLLDKEDLDFYKKAIRMRNHNLGIAAVAYLRRVVENRINDILDVLAAAAKEHDFAAEELKTIEAVKASRRFDDKIDYAAKLLPRHLHPYGKPNPIEKLHELTSEGLHSKTEEECVDIFDRVKTIFEYVFGNLQVQIEGAREFVKSLEGLVKPPAADRPKR